MKEKLFCLAPGHSLVNLLFIDNQGRIEINHISQWPQKQALLQGFIVNLIAYAQLAVIAFLGLPIHHQFHGVNQANVPNFTDMGMIPQ